MIDGAGDKLVGAWRLASARFEAEGAAPFDMYGPGAEGRLTVGPDYLSVIIIMPGSAGATPNVLAYSGRYRDRGRPAFAPHAGRPSSRLAGQAGVGDFAVPARSLIRRIAPSASCVSL